MKFCPVVPEICRGQVPGPRKERRRKRRIIINNNKNNNKKRSKNNKSSKLCLGDLINNQTLSNDWLTYCHMGLYARKK
jgi:hypothetical protein